MENNQTDKDRDLSFSIINYLSASYRGKLAGYTLLGQLQHPSFEERDLDFIQNITNRIAEWLNGLTRGEALFSDSWETLETFEAQNAISLLENSSLIYFRLLSKLKILLQNPNTLDPTSIKWLFGALTRSSFARDVYIRGFIVFAETFNKPEMRNNYGNMLIGASEHNAFIQEGVSIFKAAEFDPAKLDQNLIFSLLNASRELPAIFRTHVHDINLLASNFKGGINFNNLDFTQAEAETWKEAGIPLDIAGYWRANSFDAQQTLTWVDNLVNDPTEASAWQNDGFTPEKAKPWREVGLPFVAAIPWIQAGYVAKIAREHIDKGIFEPPNEEG